MALLDVSRLAVRYVFHQVNPNRQFLHLLINRHFRLNEVGIEQINGFWEKTVFLGFITQQH